MHNPTSLPLPSNATFSTQLIHFNKILNNVFTVTWICSEQLMRKSTRLKQPVFLFMKCSGLLPFSSALAVSLSTSAVSLCLIHHICVFIDLKDRASSEVVFGHQPPGVEHYWCGSLHQDHRLCASCTDFLGSGKKYSQTQRPLRMRAHSTLLQ